MGSDPAQPVASGQSPDLRDGVPGDVLAEARRALGRAVVQGTIRYGNGAETAGFATDAGTWLRIQWRRRGKPVSQAWAGLEAASALLDVARPELLRSFSWADEGRDLVGGRRK